MGGHSVTIPYFTLDNEPLHVSLRCMKVSVCVVSLLLVINSLCAETYEFSSTKWGMSREEVRTVMGEKFDLQPTDEDGDIRFTGEIGGEEFLGFFLFAEYGLKAVTFIFLEDESEQKTFSWLQAKLCYNKLSKALAGKYGVPYVGEFFQSPYYEGDGYELSAISQGKGTFLRVWPKEGESESVVLTIKGEGYVRLTYKSPQHQEDRKRAIEESLDEL
jgi:hypothetical protein